ncbi:type I-E CRISPR-associated protein Cse1/CasA [Streptomyces adustus]|nr:type I-E CRISPR-associated protein Cse1/CasA [Streptomyces adustus]
MSHARGTEEPGGGLLFDLTGQRWLPVRLSTGEELLSLCAPVARAHHARRLSGDLPTQDFALIRLLLAIHQYAFDGPPGTQAWNELRYERASFADVEEHLTEYRGRFGSLDPQTPLFQNAGLRATPGEVSSLNRITADVPNVTPSALRVHLGWRGSHTPKPPGGLSTPRPTTLRGSRPGPRHRYPRPRPRTGRFRLGRGGRAVVADNLPEGTGDASSGHMEPASARLAGYAAEIERAYGDDNCQTWVLRIGLPPSVSPTWAPKRPAWRDWSSPSGPQSQTPGAAWTSVVTFLLAGPLQSWGPRPIRPPRHRRCHVALRTLYLADAAPVAAVEGPATLIDPLDRAPHTPTCAPTSTRR